MHACSSSFISSKIDIQRSLRGARFCASHSQTGIKMDIFTWINIEKKLCVTTSQVSTATVFARLLFACRHIVLATLLSARSFVLRTFFEFILRAPHKVKVLYKTQLNRITKTRTTVWISAATMFCSRARITVNLQRMFAVDYRAVEATAVFVQNTIILFKSHRTFNANHLILITYLHRACTLVYTLSK